MARSRISPCPDCRRAVAAPGHRRPSGTGRFARQHAHRGTDALASVQGGVKTRIQLAVGHRRFFRRRRNDDRHFALGRPRLSVELGQAPAAGLAGSPRTASSARGRPRPRAAPRRPPCRLTHRQAARQFHDHKARLDAREPGEKAGRAAWRGGANPAKRKRSLGSPDTDSAASTEDGPGMGTTRAHRRCTRAPADIRDRIPAAFRRR